MYKIADAPYLYGNIITTRDIQFNLNIEDAIRSYSNNVDPYNYRYQRHYKKLKLKSDSVYVPIVNATNASLRSFDVSKESFVSSTSNSIIKQLSNAADIGANTEITKLMDSNLSSIYDNIIDSYRKDYSVNILLGSSQNFSNTLTVETQKQLLLSKEYSKFYPFDRGKGLIGTFFYTFDDKILLTLVVKKEFIPEFRANLATGQIDPRQVEIWVDKSIIYETDRKQLHKWIRESLMMKLAMSGFQIVEKDDILAELVYIPKFKFKSPSEISEFRSNLNKFLLV